MKLIKPSDFYSYARMPSTWIVDGLLRLNRKRISLLCGSPHAGKSTLARQLIMAIAHGEPFLGRATVQSKTLYWQSEETEEDAKEDFTQSGMRFSDDPNFVLMQPGPRENYPKELNKVLVEDPAIRLVVLETLDDFLKVEDLSNNSFTREKFEEFDNEVVARHHQRCGFLALHHFKKSDDQRSTNLNQILGATVIAGKTDAKIFLKQVSDADSRHYIKVLIRKGLAIEPTYLDFDPGTQISTLGMTLEDEQSEIKKSTLSKTVVDLRARCVDAVTNNSGLVKREYLKLVRGRAETTLAMLNSLIVDGTFAAVKGGDY
jgi:hypothetical protein